MSAVQIAGCSGAGKSTIAAVFARRGLVSIDADDDPLLARFVDRAGAVVTEVPAAPDLAWLARHDWAWDPARLDELIRAAAPAKPYLCGGADNQQEVADRFAQVFLLEIDEPTMLARLDARRDYHDWGHIGDTREYLRRKLPALQGRLIASGAIPIDARQPPDQVADAILARTLPVPAGHVGKAGRARASTKRLCFRSVTESARRLYGFELEPEVRDWLDNLSDSDYKRVDEVCGLLAEKGTQLGGPWSDHLEGQVSELRIRLRPQDAAEDPERIAIREALAFGKAVYDVRNVLGLTVADLAERTGMTEDEVECIEEGGTEPTVALLRRLAAAFDADVRLTAGHDLGSVWFETHAA